MIHSINAFQSPSIYGIPASVWIVPASIAICSYLIIKSLGNIFPREKLDKGRFFKFRNRVAKFEYKAMRKKLPQVYHFIHSSLKDNLPLVSFIAAVIILKNPDKLKSKFVITGSIILGCSLLDTIRNIVYCILLKISIAFHDRNYDVTAKRINELALRIRQSL